MDLSEFVAEIIRNSPNFSTFVEDFSTKVRCFNPVDKGSAFEWFAKAYFLANAKLYDVKTYHTRLDGSVMGDLGMSVKDVGSDSIISHTTGELIDGIWSA